MHNWYLVYTKPKNEDIVSQKFIDAGFEVLNPKLKEWKVYRRKLQAITSPLFPCYIFVKFDGSNDYRIVKYTRGVKSIIGTTGNPTIVPEEIISSILSRMTDGVILLEPQKFKPGDKVVIKAGPLEGVNAVFEREMRGTDRVGILLGSINARTTVDRVLIEKSV